MTNPEHPSWRLLQLAELLRKLESHVDQALNIVHRIYPDMARSFRRTLKTADIQRLHDETSAIARLAEQIYAAQGTLPTNEAVSVRYDDLRRSAERVLRTDARLDPATVMLALRLLDRTEGLPALAAALRSSGAYASWHTTTIGELISRLRGVSPQLARRIATAARMAPGTEISGCHPEEIARLADQLDLHARR